MKKEVMKKWVKALRSGKYKRGSGWLKQDTPTGVRHCCLGVLCEITPGVTWRKDNDKVYRARADHGSDTMSLPREVMEYAGMNTSHGYIEGKRGKHSLDDINDSGKYSFSKIADIIEKHWEKL